MGEASGNEDLIGGLAVKVEREDLIKSRRFRAQIDDDVLDGALDNGDQFCLSKWFLAVHAA